MSDDVLDIWVNLVTTQGAAQFVGQEQYANIPGYLGGEGEKGVGVDELIGRMDDLGVATGVLTPGLTRGGVADALAVADAHPGRFLVAAALTEPGKPTRNVLRIRELAEHPRFSMVRVAPLFTQVAIDDPKHYPVYQVCEELGIPVGINVGVPGPRVRSRVQHPELLEDVLIDFPELTVIGAHGGHPVRGAADQLHAQVGPAVPVVHRVRPPLPGPVAAALHGVVDRTGPGALGQRRPVVPDAALARPRPAPSTSTTRPWPSSSAAPPAASSTARARPDGGTMTVPADTQAALARLGAATLGESGAAAMGAALRPVWPGATIVGEALPVRCSPGDNLAIHVAVAAAARRSRARRAAGGRARARLLG